MPEGSVEFRIARLPRDGAVGKFGAGDYGMDYPCGTGYAGNSVAEVAENILRKVLERGFTRIRVLSQESSFLLPREECTPPSDLLQIRGAIQQLLASHSGVQLVED